VNPPPPTADLRRHLPSLERLLQAPEVQELVGRHGRVLALRELRLILAAAREEAKAGAEVSHADLIAQLSGRLEAALAPSLVRVLNATGVVIHTNLGRAPIGEPAVERIREIASCYSNLEFDLEKGERGGRESHLRRLARLVSSETALVVNNNAAAVLLAVNTLAEGREVLVSRGELVEIGGSFRIPDVIRKGGARLREVGTTNRTRLEDYERAIGPEAALILKIHPSNFAIVGFTEAVPRDALVALARKKGLPLVEDLGSGLLEELPPPLDREPTARRSVEDGVDLVTFSGDKLLGGPQAGLVAGRRALVEALGKNPLYRALRVDKMTLAALDAVLLAHESGRAAQTVPVLRMLLLGPEDLRDRATRLVEALQGAGLAARLMKGVSAVGGGAAPTADLPTLLVGIEGPSPDALSEALRAGTPPVVARIHEGRLVLDLRSVLPEEDLLLQEALMKAVRESERRRDG
jgi:L-seryl-tRNA(Ser) seleniumtransferase